MPIARLSVAEIIYLIRIESTSKSVRRTTNNQQETFLFSIYLKRYEGLTFVWLITHSTTSLCMQSGDSSSNQVWLLLFTFLGDCLTCARKRIKSHHSHTDISALITRSTRRLHSIRTNTHRTQEADAKHENIQNSYKKSNECRICLFVSAKCSTAKSRWRNPAVAHPKIILFRFECYKFNRMKRKNGFEFSLSTLILQ